MESNLNGIGKKGEEKGVGELTNDKFIKDLEKKADENTSDLSLDKVKEGDKTNQKGTLDLESTREATQKGKPVDPNNSELDRLIQEKRKLMGKESNERNESTQLKEKSNSLKSSTQHTQATQQANPQTKPTPKSTTHSSTPKSPEHHIETVTQRTNENFETLMEANIAQNVSEARSNAAKEGQSTRETIQHIDRSNTRAKQAVEHISVGHQKLDTELKKTEASIRDAQSDFERENTSAIDLQSTTRSHHELNSRLNQISKSQSEIASVGARSQSYQFAEGISESHRRQESEARQDEDSFARRSDQLTDIEHDATDLEETLRVADKMNSTLKREASQIEQASRQRDSQADSTRIAIDSINTRIEQARSESSRPNTQGPRE